MIVMNGYDNLQEQLNKVWNGWIIEELLGEGSYGCVYRISREEFGHVYESALKIITIPRSQAELRGAFDDGMDEESAKAYFYSIVERIVEEFALMAKLKGNTNIVSYEDHAVVPIEQGIGWNIFIRMEMLSPLMEHFADNTLSIRRVIQMGIDICAALEICQRYNIIHRDVKPENIFVSNLGNFKLGDFGIARQMEKTSVSMSMRGTSNYMAPEVYKGEKYGSTVDIYSLGLVLYQFLNNNRMPFMPPYPKPMRYGDKEEANIKRMSGVELPAPCNAQGRIAEIVLKACAYNAGDRYESASDMKRALMDILYRVEETDIIYPDGDDLKKADNRIDSGKENSLPRENREDALTLPYDDPEPHIGSITAPDKPVNKENDNKRFRFKSTAAVICVIVAALLCRHLYTISLQTEVPDFSGMTVEEAVEFAGADAYRLTVNENGREYSDSIDKDRIISQSIPAGERVRKGSIIKVTISSGALVRVPNLVGYEAPEAEKILESAGLMYGIKDSVYSDDVAEGRVVSQETSEGTEVEEQTVIYVTLSRGAEPIAVPDVTGMNIEEAKRALSEAGLSWELDQAYSDEVDIDCVISQDVAASSLVDRNTRIMIVVSLGSKPQSKSGSGKSSSKSSKSSEEIIWDDVD